jgi:hypothetical protein
VEVGEGITPAQAAAVSSLGTAFQNSRITSFNELATAFAHLTSLANIAFSSSTIVNILLPSGLQTIGNYCFQQTRIVEITIPASVTAINYASFMRMEGASGLEITVLRDTPPTLGTQVFQNTNLAAIYVPADSVNAYKAASNWSTYANKIQAIE